MNDIHPHWHATGDDDASSPVRTSARSGIRVPVAAASRMPAAIIGIVVFAAIGITVAGGWQALTAQITGSGTVVGGSASSGSPLTAVEVHITNTGFNPPSITVRPGQKITWINEQSIPHILTSQTLRDGSGGYLNTSAIFPGSRESFTVGPKEFDREHNYGSTTDQTLSGKIVVSKSGQALSSKSKAGAKPLGTLDDVPLPSGQGKMSSIGRTSSSRPRSSSSSSSSPSSEAIAVLQTSSSSSVAAATLPAAPPPPPPAAEPVTLDQFAPPSDTMNPPLAANVLPPPNPEPLAQPDTGPGLWMVIFSSIAILTWSTRKYLVRLR